MLRDIFFVMTISILLLGLSLLGNIPPLSGVIFQFSFAVTMYINYRSFGVLGFTAVALLLVDAIRYEQFGLSLLVFALTGLLISLLSLALPLLKQQPFWLARNLWVGLGVSLFLILQGAGTVNIISALLVNLAIINLLTLFGRRVSSDVEITIN